MLLTLLILAVSRTHVIHEVYGLVCQESLVALWLEHPTGVWKVEVQILSGSQIFSLSNARDMMNITVHLFHWYLVCTVFAGYMYICFMSFLFRTLTNFFTLLSVCRHVVSLPLFILVYINMYLQHNDRGNPAMD